MLQFLIQNVQTFVEASSMDEVIIEQPESELLSSFEGQVCEEVIELDTFRNIDQVIIQEKSHRFGGMFRAASFSFHFRIAANFLTSTWHKDLIRG